MRRLLVRGGTVIRASGTERADVLVEEERIARLGPGLEAPGVEVVDATGRYVIPGGVDVHTHMQLRVGDVVSSDDFATGTVAAAFGGTTTIVDFADQERGEPLRAGYERRRTEADGRVAVDYALHLVVRDLSPERSGEIAELVREGVTTFKLFLAYPGVNMVDDGTLLRALAAAGEAGGLVLVHAENGPAIEELRRRALSDGRTSPVWHGRTRPAELEGEAVTRAAALAAVADAPVYIVHLSSAHGLAAVREARARGIRVLAETCPQYLFLDESVYERAPEEAAAFVMSPPLRPAWHKDALWEGLARDDLQVVATDHCPFRRDDRLRGGEAGEGRTPDFPLIPNGVPGVETRMLLLHDAARRGRISLERWVETCCTAPARIMGLHPRKGDLAPGADADLVIWDPEREVRLDATSLHMRTDHSPYEDMVVHGAPEKVFLRGRLIVDGGRFVGEAGEGEWVRRAQP